MACSLSAKQGKALPRPHAALERRRRISGASASGVSGRRFLAVYLRIAQDAGAIRNAAARQPGSTGRTPADVTERCGDSIPRQTRGK
jgi:hypothetical protein